jgi:hypothetical protein
MYIAQFVERLVFPLSAGSRRRKNAALNAE